jgi:hypothetical protein
VPDGGYARGRVRTELAEQSAFERLKPFTV